MKYQFEKRDLLFVAMIIIIVGQFVFLFNQYQFIHDGQHNVEKLCHYCKRLGDKLDRNQMYNLEKMDATKETLVNGYYSYAGKFYCVWTENRTMADISRTDKHENCHWFVDNDYEHFCGGR